MGVMAEKKAKAKKPAGTKRVKQLEIEGARSPKDTQIRRLAAEYVEHRDARMEVGKKESESKKKLMLAMENKKLKVYNDGEFSVATEVVDNIKVKRLDKDAENQTEMDGDGE